MLKFVLKKPKSGRGRVEICVETAEARRAQTEKAEAGAGDQVEGRTVFLYMLGFFKGNSKGGEDNLEDCASAYCCPRRAARRV